jgi:hypothetical protein
MTDWHGRRSLNENDIFLVAVVEVEHDKRILCQAPSCGRSVYRKIHIVLESGKFILLGSDCYSHLYGSGALREPVYAWGSDRKLSDQERQQLIENTAAFIERLEKEHVLACAESERANSPPVCIPTTVQSYTPPQHRGHRGIAESSLMRVQFQLHSYADDNEYSGHKMIAWRWASSADEISRVASTWKQRVVLDSDHDLVLRSFKENPPATPYNYALLVEHGCLLPKYRTLRVLHELGLTTR